MREIKFRVYDKYMNQMLYTTNLEWYDDSFGFRLDKHTEDIEYKLMQYTGLKDINGQEIYEGDIVKNTEYMNIKGCSDVFIGDVGELQPMNYLGNYDGKCYEVIGNIYENPELLKSKF